MLHSPRVFGGQRNTRCYDAAHNRNRHVSSVKKKIKKRALPWSLSPRWRRMMPDPFHSSPNSSRRDWSRFPLRVEAKAHPVATYTIGRILRIAPTPAEITSRPQRPLPLMVGRKWQSGDATSVRTLCFRRRLSARCSQRPRQAAVRLSETQLVPSVYAAVAHMRMRISVVQTPLVRRPLSVLFAAAPLSCRCVTRLRHILPSTALLRDPSARSAAAP